MIRFFDPEHTPNCQCTQCQVRKPFVLPSELVEAFRTAKVVLFAGSGVSTEGAAVATNRLAHQVAYAVGRDQGEPFPDLMQAYCDSPAGRAGLVSMIKNHFDYIYSHQDLYHYAVRFHREVATLPTLTTFVTTNWDTYFEDECGATPFVSSEDISLWDAAERQVLKIHGSISNLGSIVATRSDYQKCQRRLRTGVVGSVLKSLLATKTVVFIGYSIRDDDFLNVYNSVKRELAQFSRRSYFVAPNLSEEDRSRLESLGVRIVETDGSFFVRRLKAYLAPRCHFADDAMFGDVAAQRERAIDDHHWLHDRYSIFKKPQILFCSWYQDGLIHALQRIGRLRKTGQASRLDRLTNVANSYWRFAEGFRRDKKYDDYAYCVGYSNGYRYAALAGAGEYDGDVPTFFFFGYEGWSRKEYIRKVNAFPVKQKRAMKWVSGVLAEYSPDDELVLDHLVTLDVSPYIDDEDDPGGGQYGFEVDG